MNSSQPDCSSQDGYEFSSAKLSLPLAIVVIESILGNDRVIFVDSCQESYIIELFARFTPKGCPDKRD